MTHKHYAWLLLIAAGALYYSKTQVQSGTVNASTTTGAIEAQLANLNSILPSPIPDLDIILAATGLWMMFK